MPKYRPNRIHHRGTDINSMEEDYKKTKPPTATIGTWNVRSLSQASKMENILQEMKRMKIDILGIAKTFFDGVADFQTILPTTDQRYRLICSGSDKKRGVAFILTDESNTTVQSYYTVSDRITCIRLGTKPVDTTIIQVYAPTNDSPQSEVEAFYEQLSNVVKLHKTHNDCLVIMGDFNGKVGDIKEEDIVGPFGLGQRNEN